MWRTKSIVLGCSLLVAGLISLATAATEDSVESEPIKAEKLYLLINLINNHKSPSWKQVVDAYHEYVHLYDIQKKLADEYEGAQSVADIDIEADKKYKLVSMILSREELKNINDTLFAMLRAEGDDEKMKESQMLRNKIETALNDQVEARGGKLEPANNN